MRVLIIDGDHLIYRHLFIPDKRKLMSKVADIPTGVVFGVLDSMAKFLRDFKRVDSCIFALGGGRAQFRTDFDPKYKNSDAPKDENDDFNTLQDGEQWTSAQMLTMQIPIIEEILRNLNVRVGRIRGYEADDLVALCVHMLMEDPANEVILVSGDADYLQAVSMGGGRIAVYIPHSEKLVTFSNFQKHLGLHPQEFIYHKAIVGDASDNIPSVAKGLGDTRTKKLFRKISSNPMVDIQTLKETAEVSTDQYERSLNEHWDRFQLNLKLMDWREIPFTPDHFHYVSYLLNGDKVAYYQPDSVTYLFEKLELIKSYGVLDDDNFKFLR